MYKGKYFKNLASIKKSGRKAVALPNLKVFLTNLNNYKQIDLKQNFNIISLPNIRKKIR